MLEKARVNLREWLKRTQPYDIKGWARIRRLILWSVAYLPARKIPGYLFDQIRLGDIGPNE